MYSSFKQTKYYLHQLLSSLMTIHIEILKQKYVLFHISTKLASSNSERNETVNKTFKKTRNFLAGSPTLGQKHNTNGLATKLN